MAVITLAGYRPSPRYDDKPWTEARIEGATSETGSYSEIETITLDPVDTDPTEPLERNFTTELVTSQTWVRVVFVDEDGDEETTLPVALTPTLFATRSDVQLRLGRDLTDDEAAQVDYLLQVATEVVAAAIGKPTSYTPVPGLVRRMTAELVARGMAAPVGVSATREQLGEYSYSQNYHESYGGFALTALEEAALRGVVWGQNTGSARTDSLVLDAEPWT